jgi:O-antigen biosynthesis protein
MQSAGGNDKLDDDAESSQHLRSKALARIKNRSSTFMSSATIHGLDPELRSDGVEAMASHPGSWQAASDQPQFIFCGPFPPGWYRLIIKMECSREINARILFDPGTGFNKDDAIEIHSDKALDLDRHILIKSDAQLIRFDPAYHPGQFKIKEFSLRPISRPGMIARSFFSKITDISARGRLFPAIKYGAQLLIQGRFREFKLKFVEAVSRDGKGALAYADASELQRYNAWRQRRRFNDEARDTIRREIKAFSNPPLFSILMPVYNVPLVSLQKAVDSVKRQLYPRWELCIADDCSTEPQIRPYLEQISKEDTRIKVVYRPENGSITTATNSAFNLASGEYVTLLDNTDELAEHALFRVAKEILADRTVDFLYSDEDKIDSQENHFEPFFKPDWSPEYLLSFLYTNRLGIYRASLVRELGGFRAEYDTAQEYDLVLRLTSRTQKISHIPDVLYHRRQPPDSKSASGTANPKSHESAQRAIHDYLSGQNIEAQVEAGPVAGLHRVRYAISGRPKISIIIPSTCKVSDGKSTFVERCIDSIIQKSAYKNYEIIVLDRNQMPGDMEKRFSKLGIRRIQYSEPFNWSRVNNLGAKETDGEHLLFLNDDIEVLSADWMEALLEHSQRPEIGAVGAKLLFPDGKVQHGGVTVLNGLPSHAFHQFDDTHTGYMHSLAAVRNFIAVTGACLMTERSVFQSVGGFDEFFPLNYNDVDYCLKVYHSGKRIVYTPYARLLHYESVSRTQSIEPLQIEGFKKRWFEKLKGDPYYNPNLSQIVSDFSIGS